MHPETSSTIKPNQPIPIPYSHFVPGSKARGTLKCLELKPSSFCVTPLFCASKVDKLLPLLDRCGAKHVVKIKANLLLKTREVIPHVFHVDTAVDCTTIVYYLNTCDGFTHFEDGTKVKSVANRLVIFPSQTYHGGTSCTDETKRVVINFNYFDNKDIYTNDLNRLYK